MLTHPVRDPVPTMTDETARVGRAKVKVDQDQEDPPPATAGGEGGVEEGAGAAIGAEGRTRGEVTEGPEPHGAEGVIGIMHQAGEKAQRHGTQKVRK